MVLSNDERKEYSMIIKNKKNVILLALILVTLVVLSACVMGNDKSKVIDLSSKMDMDFKVHYDEIDEWGNYTNLYFKYAGIKTEVFENMKLSEKGLPLVIKEDMDLDGKDEIIIYLLEKSKMYYREYIYILDFDSGTELSLDDINQKLNESEELEFKTLLLEDAFENENLVLSFIRRKNQTIEVNPDGNKGFSVVKDISKEGSGITVEVCKDETVKRINYSENGKFSSDIEAAREDFINNTIELIKISKNNKGILINAKGSYLIEYKDVNEDNVEDIIFICDVKDNKVLDENIYYLNGLDLERQNAYVICPSPIPNGYPLNMIRLNPYPSEGHSDPIIMALKDKEVFYLNFEIARLYVTCVVADFNGDGENEIIIRNDPGLTGRERFIFAYKEKDFEKIPFSTDSIYDIFESVFEYSVECRESEKVCYATIKDKNNNKVVIKVSSDTVKPNFLLNYNEEFLVADVVLVNKTIRETVSLTLYNRENTFGSIPVLKFEVIYEMQKDEFVVKDIRYTFNLDFSTVYGFENYKFEILENNIEDVK